MTTPDLERTLRGWPNGDWTALVRSLGPPSETLDEKTARFLLERAAKHLGRGQAGRAYNWSLLCLHLTAGAILADPRFAAVYQPGSKPASALKIATAVLRRLEDAPVLARLSGATSILRSWRNFLDLSIRLVSVRADFLQRILGDREAMHAAAIALEESFSEERPPHNDKVDRTTIRDLPREELAEAVSYMIAILSESGRLSRRSSFPRFSTSDSLTPARERIIMDAYRLRQLHEAEPAVFRLGYRCELGNDGAYVVNPPDDHFGMALSFGYLKTAHRMSEPSPEQWGQIGAQTFQEMCEHAVKAFGSIFARVETSPFSRLVIAIPEPAMKKIGEEFLLAKRLYKEDVWQVRQACYEMGVTIEDLDAFEVAPNLSLMDVLLISRVFRFIFLFRGPPLTDLRASDPVAYLNSVIPSGTQTDHIDRLTACGLSRQKAEAFMDLFTWSPSSSRPLDLQYNPIVDLGSASGVFLAVLSGSNTVRNALLTARRRVHDDGAVDPTTTELADALAARTTTVWRNEKYASAEGKGEVDVLAMLDGTLFAFECKNTILPCSQFEQRTLNDYLAKAARQLDRFRAAYSDEKFHGYLSKRFAVMFPPPSCLETTIVLSNRLLSGASFRGHAVRHVHELGNVLRTGVGTLQTSEKTYKLSLWRNRKFDVDVLRDYLSPSSAIYAPAWESFVRSEETSMSALWQSGGRGTDSRLIAS